MNKTIKTLVTIVLISLGMKCFAHGGGLDASGCHTDSSTGTRHCHNDHATDETDVDLARAIAVITVIGLGYWVINKSKSHSDQHSRNNDTSNTHFTIDPYISSDSVQFHLKYVF